MKVLHLNTYDNKGGAARAANRLHAGCREIGIDSRMLVQYKETEDSRVDGIYTGRSGWLVSKGREVIDSLPTYRYSAGIANDFSPAWLPADAASRARRIQHDVVHLHWITNGFVRPETIPEFDRPVVWTFHDMWPFTGGCHYSENCTKYERQCGSCPVLGSSEGRDLSRRVWERKRHAIEEADIEVVVPSKWLAECVRDSSLFSDEKVTVIPNGLDTEFFMPADRTECRKRFDLSIEKSIVLFGGAANDDRKGFEELEQAVEHLSAEPGETGIQLATFGSGFPDQSRDLGIETHYLGYVDDEELPKLYAAADVMVVPSRQESFGQTASEAMACGTPVVAFRATGLRDIVDHRRTGYLADPFDAWDLAMGIQWVLEDDERHADVAERARQRATERFSIETVATSYAEVYEKVTDRHN
jgi:glycosyltransferase involved in cell wall biosynthesis